MRDPRRPTATGGQHGFGLIDLVLTVLILGILAAVAVPVAPTDERALDAAAATVAADLERARWLAVHARTAFGVEFDVAANRNSFVLANGSTPAAAEGTLRARADLLPAEVEQLLAARTSGDAGFGRVRLHAADFAGSDRIVFQPDGSSGSGGLAELRAEGQWLRVRVQDGTGRITITAP